MRIEWDLFLSILFHPRLLLPSLLLAFQERYFYFPPTIYLWDFGVPFKHRVFFDQTTNGIFYCINYTKWYQLLAFKIIFHFYFYYMVVLMELVQLIGFPFFESQAKWIAQVLSGKRKLPSYDDMMLSIEEFYRSRELAGIPVPDTHDIANFEVFLSFIYNLQNYNLI